MSDRNVSDLEGSDSHELAHWPTLAPHWPYTLAYQYVAHILPYARKVLGSPHHQTDCRQRFRPVPSVPQTSHHVCECRLCGRLWLRFWLRRTWSANQLLCAMQTADGIRRWAATIVMRLLVTAIRCSIVFRRIPINDVWMDCIRMWMNWAALVREGYDKCVCMLNWLAIRFSKESSGMIAREWSTHRTFVVILSQHSGSCSQLCVSHCKGGDKALVDSKYATWSNHKQVLIMSTEVIEYCRNLSTSQS